MCGVSARARNSEELIQFISKIRKPSIVFIISFRSDSEIYPNMECSVRARGTLEGTGHINSVEGCTMGRWVNASIESIPVFLVGRFFFLDALKRDLPLRIFHPTYSPTPSPSNQSGRVPTHSKSSSLIYLDTANLHDSLHVADFRRS